MVELHTSIDSVVSSVRDYFGAYAHPSSRSSTRQDTMEKEINILKEEVEKLTVGNALIIDKLNHIEIEHANLKKEHANLNEDVNIIKGKNTKNAK